MVLKPVAHGRPRQGSTGAGREPKMAYAVLYCAMRDYTIVYYAMLRYTILYFYYTGK